MLYFKTDLGQARSLVWGIKNFSFFLFVKELQI